MRGEVCGKDRGDCGDIARMTGRSTMENLHRSVLQLVVRQRKPKLNARLCQIYGATGLQI